MTKSLNEGLNQLREYQHKCCIQCGRAYPETILNIEGHLKHNEPFLCVDKAMCKVVRIKNLKQDSHVKKAPNSNRGSN